MSAYTEIPKIKAGNGELPPKVLGHLDGKYPSSTAATVTYWVAPWGNDNNPGTEEHPLETIGAATSRIPDLVRRGHTYRVILKPGTFAEPVTISGTTVDGHISIEGETTDRSQYVIDRALVNNCQGSIILRNLHTTIQGEGTRAFEFRAAGPLMQLDNVSTTPDDGGPQPNSRGLLADYGSTVRVTQSDFSGKRYGVRSNYGSQIHLTSSNTGEGNDIGIATRFGGIITGQYGGLPAGETPYSTNSGGIISLGHGAVIGTVAGADERGLVSFEDYRDQGISAKTWKFDSSSAHQIPNGDIPRDSTITFRFRAPQDAVVMTVRTSWIARNTVSAHQAIDTVHHVLFRQNQIHGDGSAIHFQGRDITQDSVTVTALGRNLDFMVNISGVQSRADEWAARVTIETNATNMPFFAEPTLTT